MSVNYLHLVVLLLLTVASRLNAQRVVTSPETCLRDSDCDEYTEYCGNKFRCYKRGGLNSECSYSDVRCLDGLYCGKVNSSRVCLQQKALFEKCDPSFRQPCAIDGRFAYKCSPLTNTCRYVGFDGDACFWTKDCQIGYYCKGGNYLNPGKCAPKLQAGPKCGMGSDFDECDGFCASSMFVDFNGGICITGSQIGEPCTQNSHCFGHETGLYDSNTRGHSNIVCNIAKGNIGVCEHERDLIKKEGIKCNPAKDTCDAMRGLSCRRTTTGFNVFKCMFNKFDNDGLGDRYCDINGNFSKCNPLHGVPTECRRDFDDEDPFRVTPGDGYKEFFQCLPKIEVIPHGFPCNVFGFTVCEKGTTCRSVPGVKTRYHKYSRWQKFCVEVKKEGEKCYNKFRFECEDGLKCENNVCVKGQPDIVDTHGYLTVYCDKLPCTPGLECIKRYNYRTCELKQVEKRKGSCFRTGRTETICTGGTVCTRNEKGLGIYACRKKHGPGAACRMDEECRPPLECNTRLGRCFNPKLNIPLGEKCNQKATLTQRRCGVDTIDGYELTACLPKNKGYACQKTSGLYERCDSTKNISCSPGSNTYCSKNGVCLPRK